MPYLRLGHDSWARVLRALILILLILILAYVSLLIFGFAVFKYQPAQVARNYDRPIGGDRDAGGCLVGAGYSWCAVKNKCLRVWEEPCLLESDQKLVERYLSENISRLAPEKEVLGGKFFITRFRFAADNQVAVDYEDGHNAYLAKAAFVLAGGRVEITNFSLLEKNGASLNQTDGSRQ